MSGSPLVQFWNGVPLTGWIDGSVKPTIVGVYQRDYFSTRSKVAALAFALWDGTQWHSHGATPDAAACNPTLSAFQHAPWRGFANDPALKEGGWW